MLDVFGKATSNSLAEVSALRALHHTDEVFLLFPMGSQYDHLIKAGLEKLGFFCLVADPAIITAGDVEALGPIGIIISGGPASVYDNPPVFDREIFDLGIPVLGICYGFQMWTEYLGAKVTPCEKREFGIHPALVTHPSDLLFDCGESLSVLQNHGDKIWPHHRLDILVSTDNAPVSAARAGHLWGVQFHPEVSDTERGSQILENFCSRICGARDRFPAFDQAEKLVSELREKIKGKRVLLACSGGSDSSVVAYLLRDCELRNPFLPLSLTHDQKPLKVAVARQTAKSIIIELKETETTNLGRKPSERRGSGTSSH